MMPKRIQRKRTKGWRMPPNTVSVTRPGKWGNRYYPGSGHARGFFGPNMEPCQHCVRDPAVQVMWFREWCEEFRGGAPEDFQDYIAPLRGKNLACWCPLDQPCHADVLLELANAEELIRQQLVNGNAEARKVAQARGYKRHPNC